MEGGWEGREPDREAVREGEEGEGGRKRGCKRQRE